MIFDIFDNANSRYSFNCLSGDTKIQRLGQRKNTFNPTIEEMYLIKNDYEYAKKTGHISLYKKYKSSGISYENDLKYSAYVCNTIVNHVLDCILLNTANSYTLANCI